MILTKREPVPDVFTYKSAKKRQKNITACGKPDNKPSPQKTNRSASSLNALLIAGLMLLNSNE